MTSRVHMRQHVQDDAQVACQNCEWTGEADELLDIADFGQRVSPGEPCPAGECPECGALAHLVETWECPDCHLIYTDGTHACTSPDCHRESL